MSEQSDRREMSPVLQKNMRREMNDGDIDHNDTRFSAKQKRKIRLRQPSAHSKRQSACIFDPHLLADKFEEKRSREGRSGKNLVNGEKKGK